MLLYILDVNTAHFGVSGMERYDYEMVAEELKRINQIVAYYDRIIYQPCAWYNTLLIENYRKQLV